MSTKPGALPLELVDCCGLLLGFEPLFECLVEAFDFALGLGVSGSTVFLLYSTVEQFCFECVVGIFCAGGEYESVVCQRG